MLDVLINNAGVTGGMPQSALLATPEQFQKAFDTNVFGVVRVTQAFVDLLQKSPAPRIVMVSSSQGSLTLAADPNSTYYSHKGAVYQPTKSALNMYGLILAYELRHTPVKVNMVDPGFIKTDFNGHRGTGKVEDAARRIIRYATIGGRWTYRRLFQRRNQSGNRTNPLVRFYIADTRPSPIMKNPNRAPRKFSSLSDFHRAFGLPLPAHPLISFVRLEEMCLPADPLPEFMILDFYKIAYKTVLGTKTGTSPQARYGQLHYDFGEGGLVFTAPQQVFESPKSVSATGALLLVHPDFFLGYPLAQKMPQFGFFGYAANEALHLSAEEKETVFSIFKILAGELKSRIDDFSHDVLISQIELLLSYSNRFYKRQFLLRKGGSSSLLEKLEAFLSNYFRNEKALKAGLPTVQLLAAHVNVSAAYLSDMLRALTGQNAQQHIHNALIERAKEQLSTTDRTVSEIAYALGFEHSQSFSNLFKQKTDVTPKAFRESFN